jgi:hypothetical protein
MAHARDNDTFFTGKENKEELSRLFRHLSFFNPLTAYEALEIAKHSVNCYVKSDPLFDIDEKYKEFVQGIKIVVCPIKFNELLDALKKDDFVPRQMESHVNRIKNRISEVLSSRKIDENIQNEINQAFQESKEQLMTNALNTWIRFVRDILPDNPLAIRWLIPIFDQEDLEDFKALNDPQYGYSSNFIRMEPYAKISSNVLGLDYKCGLFGLFIHNVLYQLTLNNIIRDQIFGTPDDLSAAINSLEQKLDGLICCKGCYQKYKAHLNSSLSAAATILKQVKPQLIKPLIVQSNEWNIQYVTKVNDASASPSFVEIALLNQMAKKRFELITGHLKYPEEEHINQLDKRFEIALDSKKENRIEDIKDAWKNYLKNKTHFLWEERRIKKRFDNMVKMLNRESPVDLYNKIKDQREEFNKLLLMLKGEHDGDLSKLEEQVRKCQNILTRKKSILTFLKRRKGNA